MGAVTEPAGDPCEAISAYYRVPAWVGARVRYVREHRNGTIVGADGAYLLILLDGDTLPKAYHPTWMVLYFGERQP